ncbi:porin [Hirschia baltica]|uniref:Porin domain-containing protein n=1 Tax=Hirschia baltica (strain ATCC 49814 / DSM 5838 / IFAM 1418) TaxID=582402 RepID=C6XKB3_HIRBI|nr:porin [Hirschia baltica]ACT57711.1 hypothetical protein Hbal_0009 [Hirschia baltica ATCC 49814]
MKYQNLISGFFVVATGAGSVGQSAQAQDNPIEFNAEAVFLGRLIDENNSSESQPFATQFGVGIEKKHYFDNGMSLGFVGEIRGQIDNETRQGFAGHLQFDSNELAENSDFTGIRAPSTGLSVSSNEVDYGPYGSLEQAFLYLKSGWGELSVGRDIGAAARLDARPPRVMQFGSPNSSRLNATSSSIVRSRNDVTGPSTKITYMSPRLLGFRAGASYTPKANAKGVDFSSSVNTAGVKNANLEDVYEAGLSFSHLFRDQDFRIRLGLTGINATSSSANSRFGDYAAIGGGAEFEKGDWKLGGRYIDADNAIESENANYRAWEIGLTREINDWVVGAEFGSAKDKLLDISGENFSLGVSKPLNKFVDIGVSYISSKTEFFNQEIEGNGAVFELIVRYE